MRSAHIGKLLILLHVNFLLTAQKLIWSSSLQQNNPGKLSILHSVLQSSPNSKIYPKNPSFSPISSFQVKSCHHSSHMSLASLDCPAGVRIGHEGNGAGRIHQQMYYETYRAVWDISKGAWPLRIPSIRYSYYMVLSIEYVLSLYSSVQQVHVEVFSVNSIERNSLSFWQCNWRFM